MLYLPALAQLAWNLPGPQPTAPLTSAAIRRSPVHGDAPRTANPRRTTAEKAYKLDDKRGGVEKIAHSWQLSEVSLKRAREKRDDARRQLADGVDPTAKRRAEQDSIANTFK